MALRVTLAGQFALESEHGRTDATGLGRLGRLAFAYLLSERHRPVPRDELADVLWGEALPRSWETSLRVVLSKLRGWLGGAGLDRSGVLTWAFGCYQLHLPEPVAVDVEEAASALHDARAALATGDAAAARAAGVAASTLVAAPFLAGGSEPWVDRRQAELIQLRVQALEVLADAALAMGDPAAALAAAEDAVALDPLRESAYLRVMTAHAAAGNRGAALRAYERCRHVLADQLGVSPSAATEAAYLSLLRDAVPAPPPGGRPTVPARDAELPWPPLPAAVSSFVGRGDEVAEVAASVLSHRLVTLIGTGGVGKTRLSLEVAGALVAEFGDGAAFVPLGDLADPEGLQTFTAAALGLPENELVPELASRHVLLVLDNCEHVVAAAARMTEDLLRRCPRLTVLATSREPLGVSGEVAWRVPSLTRPEAVRLFAERGRAADPRFASDEEAIGAVVDRLDGIPLAIELAAARLPVLSVAEIASRLEDRFSLLTAGARTAPARQQTLRAAVDWTYEALREDERQLLQRLSVFAGSFTLAAVERIAALPGVLDLLDSLVRRSLIVVEGGPRFRMLETIRSYAAEKLEAPDAAATRARLLQWAVELTEEAEHFLDGPEQADWLERLEAELANLRVALSVRSEEAEDDRPLRLATSLARFWEVRGHYEEGRRVLRQLLGEARPATPADLRARAQYAAGVLAQRQGDHPAARSRYEESLALRRRTGDRYGVAVALHGLASLAALERDLATATTLYRETAALARELGQPSLLAAALTNLGWCAHTGGEFAAAQAWYDEALAVRRELGDDHGVALVLAHLGDLGYQRGDYEAAASLHAESLALRTRLGDRSGRADSLATLGHLALQSGDLTTARTYLHESLALRREVGDRAALPAALCNAADLAVLAGRPDEARPWLEEAEALAAAGRDRSALAHVLMHQARLDRAEGDLALAAKRYARAREAAGPPGPDALTAEWLEGVAATAAADGDPQAGARLLGAAAALRRTIGAAVPPHEATGLDQDLARVRSALGARFEDALVTGEQLGLDAAVAEAAAVLGRV
ncbi:MAG: tetratricopeptide repeat protein [Actinomycetota bacterium]|nr:tetratricopeptide repeat protein [Actinomycetota bacterium]